MKFIVHYEVVFEKYDNAVKGSMTVKVGDEMSDHDGNVYKVKNEVDAMEYVNDFFYHNSEDDMVDLPKDFDGDTRLDIIEVIKK
tara:strand:- start:1522 stop:1773 length:252 start_codon:yes stop_codon:yes gene_type:complete